MKPLKKAIALLMLIVGIFAFTTKSNTVENSILNLEFVNVTDVLSEQNSSCRPTSNYLFLVETNLIEKVRGASTIEAKVLLLEKSTGKMAVVSDETIVVPNYEGTVLLEQTLAKELDNGDKIIDSKADFSLESLMKFETIHNSYIKSTNKLLDLNRSI